MRPGAAERGSILVLGAMLVAACVLAVVVLVGNARAFADRLTGAGFPDAERIPLADLDLEAPGLRRGTAATALTGRAEVRR